MYGLLAHALLLILVTFAVGVPGESGMISTSREMLLTVCLKNVSDVAASL